MKLISFDLKADMGFLKKPDINEKIYLTYNMLHKPALLGILGAIAGLPGYKENGKLPEYYLQLKHLQVGIEPMDSDKGNYTKTTVSYNNTTGFASSEEGGNLIVTEQILIKPSFRCYLLLNTENEVEQTLYQRICNQEAEYLPYFGKNDFSVWWDKFSVQEYTFNKNIPESTFTICSIFCKGNSSVQAEKEDILADFDFYSTNEEKPVFFFFEKLPIQFDEILMQYQLADFAYTTAKIKQNTTLTNIYCLNNKEEKKYVQLF